MAFACNQCGACCKAVKRIRPDWPTRLDGACLHLTQDNRCAVYETRPLVCRVDDARPSGVTVELWHRLNAEGCAKLQNESGQ